MLVADAHWEVPADFFLFAKIKASKTGLNPEGNTMTGPGNITPVAPDPTLSDFMYKSSLIDKYSS